LFRAVVARAPILDMLRYQYFPAGSSWTAEYGSSDHSDQFPALWSYSPDHRVRPGTKDPGGLFSAFAAEAPGQRFHARKMTPALQAENASSPADHPILLRIDRLTGLSPDAQQNIQLRDLVDQRLFLMWQLGMR